MVPGIKELWAVLIHNTLNFLNALWSMCIRATGCRGHQHLYDKGREGQRLLHKLNLPSRNSSFQHVHVQLGLSQPCPIMLGREYFNLRVVVMHGQTQELQSCVICACTSSGGSLLELADGGTGSDFMHGTVQ